VIRATAYLALAVWVIAGCGPSLPPTPEATTPATSSATASSTPAELDETASAPPQISTDAPQPAPEGLIRLTDDPARDSYAAWSGDGERIAFYSNRSGVDEIYAMNADGTEVIQLTQDGDIRIKQDPAWSADGLRMAFTALFDVYRIFTFDVAAATTTPFNPSERTNEGFPKPLSADYRDALNPAWSPDGQRIALTMDDLNGDRQVYTLDLASGETLQVTHGPSPAYFPRWSPDGGSLAFSTNAAGDFDIYIIGAQGEGLTQLTNDPSDEGIAFWSPDSQFLVFDSDRGGSYGLYVMRADGGEASPLNTGAGDAFSPAWSPDGRYIAFGSNRDGNPEIYRIDAPALQP